jgi:hypothetical protein
MNWNTYRLKTGVNEAVASTWNTYQKTAPIVAKQIHHAFCIQTKEGKMKGKPGDYLAVGIEGEAWPIDQQIFQKSMKMIASGVSAMKEYFESQ